MVSNNRINNQCKKMNNNHKKNEIIDVMIGDHHCLGQIIEVNGTNVVYIPSISAVEAASIFCAELASNAEIIKRAIDEASNS